MTTSKHYPVEDMTEAALWNGWDTLKEYLSIMEDHLQKTTEQFEASVNEQKKTLTPEQFNEFEIDHVEEYVYYRDEFPYILRNSFLVSAISLLEYDMGRICESLRKIKGIQKSWSDLRGDIFEKFKQYYKKANLPLSVNDPAWQEIQDYYLIRNCVVHNMGLINKNVKKFDELKNFVKKKDIIKERHIIFDDAAEQEIGLTENFCEEAVDTMQKFIDAAYKNAIRRLEK